VLKDISTTIFKDPRVPVTQLLNILEDNLGGLFKEENRSAYQHVAERILYIIQVQKYNKLRLI